MSNNRTKNIGLTQPGPADIFNPLVSVREDNLVIDTAIGELRTAIQNGGSGGSSGASKAIETLSSPFVIESEEHNWHGSTSGNVMIEEFIEISNYDHNQDVLIMQAVVDSFAKIENQGNSTVPPSVAGEWVQRCESHPVNIIIAPAQRIKSEGMEFSLATKFNQVETFNTTRHTEILGLDPAELGGMFGTACPGIVLMHFHWVGIPSEWYEWFWNASWDNRPQAKGKCRMTINSIKVLKGGF